MVAYSKKRPLPTRSVSVKVLPFHLYAGQKTVLTQKARTQPQATPFYPHIVAQNRLFVKGKMGDF
jgi:hypothetical protein